MVKKGLEGISVIAFSLALVGQVGCGSPTSTGTDSLTADVDGIRLNGRFTSRGAASTLGTYEQTSYEGIKVFVREDPDIETMVEPDGSFTLRGLPPGQFTLVVMGPGDAGLGEIPFQSVLANSEITILLELGSGGVVVLEQKRTGIGHGDVELEGVVEEVTPGSHDHEGTLVVNGYTVLARPGETAIREGNRARIMADIRVETQVHVKGVWESPSILAHEILLQDEDEEQEDGNDTVPSGADCPNLAGGKLGRKIVLEGTVLSLDDTGFRMRAEGRTADIHVSFDGAPRCVGEAGKADSCTIGELDKVHVTGTLETCEEIVADEVKIQKKGGG